jgi:hypothetical protein
MHELSPAARLATAGLYVIMDTDMKLAVVFAILPAVEV